jgi:hypothetical protein
LGRSASPTLKRGASKRCASGALIRTFAVQPSIMPAFLADFGTTEVVPFHEAIYASGRRD